MLKAKIGGVWTPIGIPKGGAVGDFLIKSGAPTDWQTRWGTDMPRLTLTSATEADLTSTLHPLQIGQSGGLNIRLDTNEIQGVNNAAASALNLNPHGGNVIVGAISNVNGVYMGQHPSHGSPGIWRSGLTPSPAAQYNFLMYGNDTYLNADSGDWGLRVDNSTYLQSDRANGTLLTSKRLDISGNQSLYFRSWGGGWYMSDTTWIRAVNDKYVYTGGEIRTGNKFSFDGAGWKFTNSSDTDTGIYWYSDGDVALLANGGQSGVRPNGTTLTVYGTVSSHTVSPPLYVNGGDWIRKRGSEGFYMEDRGTGWWSNNNGWMELYAGSMSLPAGSQIRLKGSADSSHYIVYSNMAASSVHPASGQVSDGPYIVGYQTVILGNVSRGNSNFLHAGSVFIDTAYAYNKYSSSLIKEDIETIDREQALDEVRRWRPVTYQRKGMPERGMIDGFIAEELWKVNPNLVECVQEDRLGETPEQIEARNADPDMPSVGAPHALDYGALTVRLTAAMQALADRVEMLERELEWRRNESDNH